MNKKFSTLVASFLLAGGLFSSANASIQKMTEGQYYRIAVGATTVNSGSFFLDSDKSDTNWYSALSEVEADKDGSAWWRVEVVKDPVTGKALAYKLVNKKGVYYTVSDGTNDYDAFKAQTKDNSVTLKDSHTYWILVPYDTNLAAYQGDAVESTNTKWGFHNIEIEPVAQSADDLNGILGNSFALQIGKQKWNNSTKVYDWSAYTTFEGENVFAGTLYAKQGTNGVELYTDSKKTQRIVLTTSTWNVVSSSLEKNYKFDILNTKDYADAVDNDKYYSGDQSKLKIVADDFVISVPAIVAGEPVDVTLYNKMTSKADLEVVVAVVNNDAGQNVNRLTVATSNTTKAEYTMSYDGKNLTSSTNNTYIKLGVDNFINTEDFIGKLWNIKMNGRTLSPECSENETPWVESINVYDNGAEGLWLWNESEGEFANRESDATWKPKGLRYTTTVNTYVDAAGNIYTITPAGDPAPNGTTDGYLSSLTDDELRQQAFFIGTPRSTGDTVYIAKGSNGVLTFTLDKTEAVAFRMTRKSFGNNKYEAQLRNTYSYWKNEDEWANKTDVVMLYQYNIEEAVSHDALYYNSTDGYYTLVDTTGWYKETGKTFEPVEYVFKDKGVDLYNILMNVSTNSYDSKNKRYTVKDENFCDGVTKLYGAHNVGRLVEAQGAYANVQNDLFVVINADAQQYRGDFSNEDTLENVKIFRNDDNSYVLYEKGTLLKDANNEVLEGFLGLENIYDPQYAEVNAALLADTAKHANTYRPQYMFAVDATIVPAGKWCPIHGTDCKDEHLNDTEAFVEGRYLVNLVDSVKAGRKDCVYQNYGGDKYYRLGFVAAKHIGDSLIIASSNDTILVNKGNDEVCTYALKYVDGNRDAFIIETLYNYTLDADGDVDSRTPGYVKYHNGIPVVTSELSEAEVFDLDKTEEEATANETIAASAVTVIAGEGNVTIAGAAGKKVVIANILGQTIANTVLTSDNATIAAPAGVVVVAVEGEAAVKAIVK